MTAGIESLFQDALERKQRRNAALEAVRALPPQDRREVIAELIELERQAEPVPAKHRVVPQPAKTPAVKGQTFTDKAEAYVLGYPEGVDTAAVARAIGQDVSAVDGTLRQVMSKRGTIKRDRGRWWPTNAVLPALPDVGPPAEAPPRTTIRNLIVRAFSDRSNAPLGTAQLFTDLQQLEPRINRASVEGEMVRMRKDKLLIQTGVGPNTGGLYKLVTPEEPTNTP